MYLSQPLNDAIALHTHGLARFEDFIAVLNSSKTGSLCRRADIVRLDSVKVGDVQADGERQPACFRLLLFIKTEVGQGRVEARRPA